MLSTIERIISYTCKHYICNESESWIHTGKFHYNNLILCSVHGPLISSTSTKNQSTSIRHFVWKTTNMQKFRTHKESKKGQENSCEGRCSWARPEHSDQTSNSARILEHQFYKVTFITARSIAIRGNASGGHTGLHGGQALRHWSLVRKQWWIFGWSSQQ